MNNITKKKTLRVMAICFFVLTVIIIVFLMLSVIWGNHRISNTIIEPKKNITITCSIDDLRYPYFSYNNAYKQSTEIRIVFEDEIFQAISLVHRMYYSNKTQANYSHAINVAELNKSFGEKPGAFAFNSKFDVQDSLMQFTMYADSNSFNNDAIKYFLIEEIPQSATLSKEYYSQKGFRCSEL